MRNVNMFGLNKLHELLIPWISNCPKNIVLTGLKVDSRDIVPGNLFITVLGSKTDGKLYINHAITNGAIAVLTEYNRYTVSVKNTEIGKSVPVMYLNKLNKYISNISGRFYGYPSLCLDVVGVTGTNGKTTITHLLTNWVEVLGEKSAVIGTLGYGLLNNLHFTNCTTCSAIDTQRILRKFIQNKIRFVAMEVSSHGLEQCRVDAIYFNVAIFSNLGYDHLDYHKDIKKYESTKWRLFSELHVEYFVINADDVIGVKWLLRFPKKSVAVTIKTKLSKSWEGKWIHLVKANYYMHGTDIVFDSSWGTGIINSRLLGSFNVSNLLLALGALLIMGYPLKQLLYTASQLSPICGRVEVFNLSNANGPTIIIDYAHTPDALEQVLSFMKELCDGKLWCVFGCGGNRDRSKRMLMGLIADQYSNHIIITNDNPRTENPQDIINDIIYGIKYSRKIKIIKNRVHAIKTAISMAQYNDFVLIFGKGHERYQIIGKQCIDYSDRNVVKNFLINK